MPSTASCARVNPHPLLAAACMFSQVSSIIGSVALLWPWQPEPVKGVSGEWSRVVGQRHLSQMDLPLTLTCLSRFRREELCAQRVRIFPPHRSNCDSSCVVIPNQIDDRIASVMLLLCAWDSECVSVPVGDAVFATAPFKARICTYAGYGMAQARKPLMVVADSLQRLRQIIGVFCNGQPTR